MRISLIVAAAENGVIGNRGKLPWHLPDDLKHFKKLTSGKMILMGRKTAESIGKPLPNRRNLVLSRKGPPAGDGWEWVKTWDEAVALAAGTAELMVIGGAEVYALALPHADSVYLTRVQTVAEGDVELPELGPGWVVEASEFHPADEKHAFAFSFLTLRR